MEKLIANGITYDMTVIDSKAAKMFGHDKASNTLAIVFGYAPTKVYIYSNVSYQKHTPLFHADSFGSHFHAKIRNDKASFPFEVFDIN